MLLVTTENLYGSENSANELTFITPANMISSYKDTPNSVTSLDARDLQNLGIDNFVDAMRLVPGMQVTETHGSSAAIGYHGTNVNVPRRMQILYNSNSLYRAGYADVIWQRMPIEVSDLERIEIVRGTNIADYGTNAFSSTVNLIQKPVALETESMINLKISSTNEQKVVASLGGNLGLSKGYIRVAAIKSEGFDRSPQLDTFNDDHEGHSLLYNGELDLSNSLLLDWYIASSEYEYEFPRYDNLKSDSASVQKTVGGASPDGKTNEKTLSGSIKLSGSSVEEITETAWKVGLDVTNFNRDQNLIFCYPAILYDPNLATLDTADNIQIDFEDTGLLIGSSMQTGVGALNKSLLGPLNAEQIQLLTNFGAAVRRAGPAAVASPLCASTNQDLIENRYKIFGGFNRSTDYFTYSSNLAVRMDDVDSQTYLGGSHTRSTYEWSNNIRQQVTSQLVLNVGVMTESNSDIDKVYFSPRVSFNFSVNDQNIIRLLAAESNRLPGVHETERQWRYHVNYLAGKMDYYNRASADTFRIATTDDLEPEKLRAYELAYTYLTQSNKTVVDVKYFKEKYSNLISQPFNYLAFTLTNNGVADVDGVEIGVGHKLNDVKFGGGISYLENDTDTLEEKSLYSRVSGSAWSIFSLSENVNLGLVYYGSKNQAKNNYDRVDANLNYVVRLAKTELSFDFNVRHLPKDQATYTEYSSSDPFILGYKDRDIYSIRSKLTF